MLVDSRELQCFERRFELQIDVNRLSGDNGKRTRRDPQAIAPVPLYVE